MVGFMVGAGPRRRISGIPAPGRGPWKMFQISENAGKLIRKMTQKHGFQGAGSASVSRLVAAQG